MLPGSKSILIYTKYALFKAVVLASCLHAGVLYWVTQRADPSEKTYQTLAVMDFSDFDPEGGKAGGDSQESLNTEETADTSQEVDELVIPEPESRDNPAVVPPEAEPEPAKVVADKPDEEVVPKIAESTSDKADVRPVVRTEKDKPKVSPVKPRTSTVKPNTSKTSRKSERAKASASGTDKGGTGDGTGKGNPNALAAYHKRVLGKIKAYQKYPPEARSKGLAGIVTVNFTIEAKGQVTGVRIVGSSGHQILDNEVKALMKRVSPFPELPMDIGKKRMNLNVPIRFTLR